MLHNVIRNLRKRQIIDKPTYQELEKRIAEPCEIKTHLTSYVARHSFANVLKNAGINIASISKTLGHSELSTTQIYLDSFENKQFNEAMKHLL